MSRDGQWPIFEGTWLSTFILLCLGVFFTYKAVNDSVLFNIESYSAFVREVLGIQKKKTYNKKEVIIEPVIKEEFIAQINDINAKAEKYLSQLRNKQMINYLNFYTHHHQPDSPEELVIAYNLFIERGSNSDDRDILKLLSDYPTLYKKKFGTPLKNKIGGTLISLLLPFSIPYYFFALFKRYRNIKAVEEVINNNQKLLNLLQEKS